MDGGFTLGDGVEVVADLIGKVLVKRVTKIGGSDGDGTLVGYVFLIDSVTIARCFGGVFNLEIIAPFMLSADVGDTVD